MNDKSEKIFNAITDVDSKLIEEAKKNDLKTITPDKNRHSLFRLAAVAACFVVIAGALYLFPKQSGSSAKPLADVILPKAYAFDDLDAEIAVRDANPVDDLFLESIKKFSYKTSSQILASGDSNINYSPLSLYYALSMAASGAKGETAEELLNLLGSKDFDDRDEQCGNLYRLIYTDNEISKLKIANSLWMDKKINWKPDFVNNAAKNYYASSFSVDFADAKTAKAIEKWISDNTKGLLAPKVDTDPEQILSIINTVYFYDEWVDKFDKKDTSEDKFFISDGSFINCDFMNTTFGSAAFFKGEGYTRSCLGLKNSGQMIFILPDKGVSVRDLISSPDKMEEAFEGGDVNCGEVVWKVPKFNFSSQLNLIETLKSLGLNSVFDKGANFSGITDHIAFLNSVTQNTRISIDENGVEAAAFTSLDYAGSSMPMGRAEMILDRPFIYGITASDGTLLFAGICENPSQDQ